MAESVTITEETHSTVKKISFVWVTAADGTATGATPGAYSGSIERLVTVPAGGGSAPTDNYDIAINDGDTTDVLLAAGANRSSTLTQQVGAASLGIVANDTLTLEITNAGDTKGGAVYLYIR